LRLVNITDLRQSCTGENSGQRAAVGGRDAGLDAFCSSLQACFLVLKREQTTGLLSAPKRIRLAPMSTAPNHVTFTVRSSLTHSLTHSLTLTHSLSQLTHSLTHSLSQLTQHLQLPRTTFFVICSVRGAERGWTLRGSTGKC
jgi:hypothetical protein